jgi:hypothetical protein
MQRLPLPDDGIHYVGHGSHENEQPNWFIDIGAPWQQRRFLGGSENVIEEGIDGRSRIIRRRRRWSV